MLRYLAFWAAMVIAIAAPHSWAAEVIVADAPVVLAAEGKGALLEMSGQKVLILKGSPYEMGYQHGKLMGEPVRQLTAKVLSIVRGVEMKSFLGAVFSSNQQRSEQEFQKFTAGSLEAAFIRTSPFIPARYNEELRGMSEATGIPLKDLQLANIFPELFHCSGFALFGSATQNQTLLHGRILDYFTEMGFQDFAVVMVVKPDGLNAFVNVGYAGFIGSVTGMNAKHVAFGEMGGRGEGDWDGMPMAYLMRKAMEEADTLDEAVAIFRDTPRTCEYFYVISDSKIPDARGLACWPDRFIEIKPGQAVDLLPHAVEDAVLLSAGSRYEHLVRLVTQQHGDIDIKDALQLMDRPVAMNSCLHRVLFEPAALKLWVANAAAVGTPNFQAQHQPYYEYDFAGLLAFTWEN